MLQWGGYPVPCGFIFPNSTGENAELPPPKKDHSQTLDGGLFSMALTLGYIGEKPVIPQGVNIQQFQSPNVSQSAFLGWCHEAHSQKQNLSTLLVANVAPLGQDAKVKVLLSWWPDLSQNHLPIKPLRCEHHRPPSGLQAECPELLNDFLKENMRKKPWTDLQKPCVKETSNLNQRSR